MVILTNGQINSINVVMTIGGIIPLTMTTHLNDSDQTHSKMNQLGQHTTKIVETFFFLFRVVFNKNLCTGNMVGFSRHQCV